MRGSPSEKFTVQKQCEQAANISVRKIRTARINVNQCMMDIWGLRCSYLYNKQIRYA